VNTTTHLPPQYDQLTSERHVLCLKSAFRLNGETNRVRKKQSSAIIAADVRRFSYLINTDEVFGTHTSGNGGENHALVVERHPAPSVIVTTYQECTFCAENSRQSTSRGEGSLIRNQAT
jgi:hypothetical protein